MTHRRENQARTVDGNGATPAERHAEFAEENGKWHREVEESLSELEELAREPERERGEESAPAKDRPART